MTNSILLIIVIFFIIIFILAIYFFDKNLVKKIESYEKRLEKKGILKRHFISKNTKE